jgi:hypothetical protein
MSSTAARSPVPPPDVHSGTPRPAGRGVPRYQILVMGPFSVNGSTADRALIIAKAASERAMLVSATTAAVLTRCKYSGDGKGAAASYGDDGPGFGADPEQRESETLD